LAAAAVWYGEIPWRVLQHNARSDGRVFKEIAQLGDEMKLLAPALKDTHVQAETCIL